MESSEPVGRMYLGTAGYKALGKLIDEWTFQQPFHGADSAAPYKIEVFMRKRHVGAGTAIHGVIEFVAHCAALPETMMVNSDIEALRVAVEEHLREQAILSSGVQWEDWLEVIVHGGVSTTVLTHRPVGRAIAYLPSHRNLPL